MSHQSYTRGPDNGNMNGNGAGTSMSASLSPNGVQRGLSQQSHDMVRPTPLSYKSRPSVLELINRHPHHE
jgi:hypothetical protein